MEILITNRLILREWKENDSADLYEYAKSELVGPSAGWPPHKNEKESKEIIQMFIENKECYAIVLKSENKVIVPEAVKCLTEYGLNQLNLDLIWCGHFDFNHNSKRVNEKCEYPN